MEGKGGWHIEEDLAIGRKVLMHLSLEARLQSWSLKLILQFYLCPLNKSMQHQKVNRISRLFVQPASNS